MMVSHSIYFIQTLNILSLFSTSVGEYGAEKLKNSGELLYNGIDFIKPIKATVPF